MNVLYQFAPANHYGVVGTMMMDSLGNLYAAVAGYGASGNGMILNLTPNGGAWSFSDLHGFTYVDGSQPFGDLTMDASGNLYGTTMGGGLNVCGGGCGVVWKLAP
jgi:uncharacterized repeat protein (TIGR03803 family)